MDGKLTVAMLKVKLGQLEAQESLSHESLMALATAKSCAQQIEEFFCMDVGTLFGYDKKIMDAQAATRRAQEQLNDKNGELSRKNRELFDSNKALKQEAEAKDNLNKHLRAADSRSKLEKGKAAKFADLALDLSELAKAAVDMLSDDNEQKSEMVEKLTEKKLEWDAIREGCAM